MSRITSPRALQVSLPWHSLLGRKKEAKHRTHSKLAGGPYLSYLVFKEILCPGYSNGRRLALFLGNRRVCQNKEVKSWRWFLPTAKNSSFPLPITREAKCSQPLKASVGICLSVGFLPRQALERGFHSVPFPSADKKKPKQTLMPNIISVQYLLFTSIMNISSLRL